MLITPNVYSYTELMEGKEHRKRPTFIIITIVAKVTDRRKGSHLQGWVDKTGHPLLTNAVFHAMHVILSLKLGDHEGLPVFVHGRLLQRTLLIVLLAILIQILMCAFLSTAESSPGLHGAAWQLLAGRQHPGTQLRETQY